MLVLTACIDYKKFLVCGETNFYEIYVYIFYSLNHDPLSSLETYSSITLSTVLSNCSCGIYLKFLLFLLSIIVVCYIFIYYKG